MGNKNNPKEIKKLYRTDPVTLSEVVQDADKISPGYDPETKLTRYIEIQRKVLERRPHQTAALRKADLAYLLYSAIKELNGRYN